MRNVQISAHEVLLTLSRKLEVRDRKHLSSGSALDVPGFGSLLGSSRTFAESSPRGDIGRSTSEAPPAIHADSMRGAVPTLDLDTTAPINPTGNGFDDRRPRSPAPSLIRSAISLHPAPAVRNFTRRDPGPPNAINNLGLVMKTLCGNIPRSVNANVSMRGSYISFTISQCEYYSSFETLFILRSQPIDDLLRVGMFFQPLPVSMMDTIAVRMKRSGAILWFLYLGAKIFERLKESPRHAVVRPFVHWLNKYDQQITNTLDPNCSVEELENRLAGALEVSISIYLSEITCLN